MSAPVNPDDPGGLRLALNWFHTWFGLFIGGLLFVIFWTGTMAVFDREIDRWMMPATRAAQVVDVSPDRLFAVSRDLAPDAKSVTIILPDERTPVAQLMIQPKAGEQINRYVDPATLRVLPDQGTLGGERFFYPYHFTLNIEAYRLGLVLCALAAVVMVALCISGVIVHRKIFADFFTLRIVRKAQRTTLDLHNLTGVLALPFHLMIAFTGVAIFTFTYLPSAQAIVFASDPAAAGGGWFSRKPAREPGGPMVSLETIREQAAARWDGDRPLVLRVAHPRDANAYVEVQRPSGRTISYRTGTRLWFDGASGDLLGATPETASTRTYQFLYGIHAIQFDHWVLRWLYFVSGLAGCVLIGTGLLFWVQSRRKRHEKQGLRGVRIAEAASVGLTAGLLIASLAFLIANRLLPLGLEGRSAMEVQAFHTVWLLATVHAFVRGRSAWAEQAWAIAAGAVAAVLLNACTTADALPVAMARGLWSTAGVDLTLVAAAVTAGVAAMRLRRADRRRAGVVVRANAR